MEPAAPGGRPLRILMLGGAMRRVHGYHVAVRGLAAALAAAGHEVTLLQTAPRGAREPLPGVRIRYGHLRDKGLLSAAYALRPLGRYDLIHGHDYTGGWVGLRSRFGAPPLIASVHAACIRAERIRGANSRWRGILRSTRLAQRIVVPSAWLRQELVTRLGVPTGRIETIPWGVAEHWHARCARPRHSGERFRVALVNMKGVPVALRAVAELPGVQLDLYGAHRHMERYRALAEALRIAHRVRFHGFLPNESLAPRLLSAHCLVHPTPSESFGQVVAEAAAIGLPVVASHVAAVPEIVAHQETGLLCRPNDVKGFARALKELSEDQGYAAGLGRAARRRATRVWRWERTASKLTREVYEPVVRMFAERRAVR